MLETAQGQNEIFDLNIQDVHGGSKGLPAMLTRILSDALELEVLAYVSREMTEHGRPAVLLRPGRVDGRLAP